jgi:hypothetical protein
MVAIVLCTYGIANNATTKTDCLILDAHAQTRVSNFQLEHCYKVNVRLKYFNFAEILQLSYEAGEQGFNSTTRSAWEMGNYTIPAQDLVGVILISVSIVPKLK